MTRDLDGATVVFDLDGTLVDTAPDLLRALERVMAAEGLEPPPPGALRQMVGQGARVLIERAAAMQGIVYPPDRLTALTGFFIDFYRADIAGDSTPFPGAEAALDALAAAGARLSVCTNKRTDLSALLLDRLGLAGRFAAIVGADAVPEQKPAPGHYAAAVAAAGGTIRMSVMVGDSAADVAVARSAGAPAIAVRFGYCEGDVEALGADILIADFAELPGAVRAALRTPGGRRG
jgi:phosphoglycolate phosphatase